MKCPHCQEELGLNNICTNPICSYFGTTIELFEESHSNNRENNPNENSSDNYENVNKTTNTSSNLYNNNNISTNELAAFINTSNSYYYLEYTPKMKNNTKFVSWNWSCFFLGTYWLLYRKLYAFAAILIASTTALELLLGPIISPIFLLAMRIVLTMFSNSIYLNRSVSKIKAVKVNILNFSTTQYINMLQKKGGVNLAAPIILLVLYIIFVIILFICAVLFFAPLFQDNDFSSPSYNF